MREARGGGCDKKKGGGGTWPHRTETPTGRVKRDWKAKNSLSFPTEAEIHIIIDTRECEKEVAFCNTQIIITHSVLWEKHGRKTVGGRAGLSTLRMCTARIPRKTRGAYPEQGHFSFLKFAVRTARIELAMCQQS